MEVIRNGFGRPSSPHAEALSRDLRHGHDPAIRRRRRVAGLSIVAGGALGLVALYQMGLVRHLPEPPLRVFDADRVDASGEAYRLGSTPDAALGIASYAVTLALAGMGPSGRAHTQPWVPLALAAKVALDAGSGALLTVEQISRHRALCFWCLLASLASLVSAPLTLPEARDAWRSLRGPG